MSSPFKADSERSDMDCYQPEQTATAALKDNENHTPNTAAASCPDLAISPEHNKTEEVVKIETEDIYQINKSHTTTSQNHKSNAPSPEAATVTNTPRPLDYKPPSKDVDTEMRIADLVDQSTPASQGDKNNKSNSTAVTGLQPPIPNIHEPAMKDEAQTKSPDQSKSTDSWKSATHSKSFEQHRDGQLKEKQPSAAIADSKPNKNPTMTAPSKPNKNPTMTAPSKPNKNPTMTAPSKPQPAALSEAEIAARARRFNAESKSPIFFLPVFPCLLTTDQGARRAQTFLRVPVTRLRELRTRLSIRRVLTMAKKVNSVCFRYHDAGFF